jgi:hypothetical protein
MDISPLDNDRHRSDPLFGRDCCLADFQYKSRQKIHRYLLLLEGGDFSLSASSRLNRIQVSAKSREKYHMWRQNDQRAQYTVLEPPYLTGLLPARAREGGEASLLIESRWRPIVNWTLVGF